MEISQLELYVNDPELALQNFEGLLAILDSQDSSIRDLAVEALENCGAPGFPTIPKLLEFLERGNSLQVYWASTLLGRTGANLSTQEPHGEVASKSCSQQIQERLCKAMEQRSLELSAQERIVWALGQLPELSMATRVALEQRLKDTLPPRLTRLIEAALSTSAA